MTSVFQIVLVGLIAAVAWSQELQVCGGDTRSLTVASTEDAAALATSLECSDGDFVVQWVGEVLLEEIIHVTNGTSLNVTGAGEGAVADGRHTHQIFVVDAGSSLHLADMTLAHGFASAEAVITSGGAVFSRQASVSLSGNMSFISNSAHENGGAIYAYESTLYWESNSTQFSNNSASFGGAIYAWNSTVSWDGDGARFISNSADEFGGAISAHYSRVAWEGDIIQFKNNSAGDGGGAIYEFVSTVWWEGDGTQFSHNSANVDGGAVRAHDSTLSWDGDAVRFDSNSATDDGGAIFASRSTVSWDRNTTFSGNDAGKNGGALALVDVEFSFDDSGDVVVVSFSEANFFNNSARNGGGMYLANSKNAFNFTGIVLERNSADGAGGAVAAYEIGTEERPLAFSKCNFSNNVASEDQGTGGAVETLSGHHEFISCTFEGNSAGEEKQATNHRTFSHLCTWAKAPL